MKVAMMDRYDLLNTPGEDKPAFTIWFSGCSMRCNGCHNPSLFDGSKGSEHIVGTIMMVIDTECDKTGIDTVVLLGGEPLEQNHRELIDLCHRLVDNGYKIWLYTGWRWEDIPADLLQYLYTVKYGSYDITLAVDGFPASSNQGIMRAINGVWTSITI